ncbi:hypothetical protein [Nocardia tenerifensis]|nr:hypothetical protein [Nocardia tenerifensis]
MNQGLTVRCVGDPAVFRAEGSGRFTVCESDGRFRLPVLELAPLAHGSVIRLIDLRPELASARGPLADRVLASWTAAPLSGTTFVDPVRTDPTEVEALAPGHPDEQITVAWIGTFVAEPDPPREFRMVVQLSLESSAPKVAGRKVSDIPRHPGWVALDFGTSNSTAVLFDQDNLSERPLARQQAAALRDQVVALLRDPSLPPTHARQFAGMMDAIARTVPTIGESTGDARDRLVAALDSEPVDNPRHRLTVLYGVLLGLERALPGLGAPLRSWLADRLHGCYDAAFAVPGLDGLQLFPVELDAATGGHELPSRIEVTGIAPLAVQLSADDDPSAEPALGRYHHGLKQYLGKPQGRIVDAGTGETTTVSTDDLIEAALWFLIERTDDFIAAHPGSLARGRLNQAVLTYPTVAPPIVRHRLRELMRHPRLRDGLDLVETSYDEAVAAVMFFLMRDFGGEFEIGIEAVKARYRFVSQSPPAWKQNILVIDIGGGTTDIALVTMVLADRTAPDPGADIESPWYGRYYVLTPKVRGSSGHLQLGGEYLTLRVFHWLKAVVVDLLLTTFPANYGTPIQSLPRNFRRDEKYRSDSLVHAVRADCEDRDVLDALESVLPTRWRTDQHNEQAFWLLWRLADRAKAALGRPDAVPFPLTRSELVQLVHATTAGAGLSATELERLPQRQLGVHEFGQLIAEPLAEVMRLATGLVLDAFKSEPAEKLDRIILTGKTSALTQVRHALSADFGRGDDSGAHINWDSSGVTVEHEYAKSATAIGACWAESIRQYGVDLDNAHRRLREGKTVLAVEVENLFYNLPCSFRIKEQEGAAVRLTSRTELVQLDADPIGKARGEGEWDALTPAVSVYRVISGGHDALWGNFRFEEYARHEQPPSVLDSAVWPHEIKAQLEVTQELDLSIHLCRGGPHYVVAGPSISVLDAIREVFGPEFCGPDGTVPDVLPGDILVDSIIGGSTTRSRSVVFPAGEPLSFDATFFENNSAPADLGIEGLQARTDLDAPVGRRAAGAAARWEFTLHYPGGQKRIGELRQPVLSAGRFPTRYHATLDRRGRLRVHGGALPYRTATSLSQVESDPGRVHTVRLPAVRAPLDEARDPFSGAH